MYFLRQIASKPNEPNGIINLFFSYTIHSFYKFRKKSNGPNGPSSPKPINFLLTNIFTFTIISESTKDPIHLLCFNQFQSEPSEPNRPWQSDTHEWHFYIFFTLSGILGVSLIGQICLKSKKPITFIYIFFTLPVIFGVSQWALTVRKPLIFFLKYMALPNIPGVSPMGPVGLKNRKPNNFFSNIYCTLFLLF